MLISNPDLFQIVGDGEKVGIIVPEQGLYLFENYVSTNFLISTSRDIIDVSPINGEYKRFLPKCPNPPVLELRLQGKLNYIENGSVQLFTKNLIQNMTIVELFRIINEKIEERK